MSNGSAGQAALCQQVQDLITVVTRRHEADDQWRNKMHEFLHDPDKGIVSRIVRLESVRKIKDRLLYGSAGALAAIFVEKMVGG